MVNACVFDTQILWPLKMQPLAVVVTQHSPSANIPQTFTRPFRQCARCFSNSPFWAISKNFFQRQDDTLVNQNKTLVFPFLYPNLFLKRHSYLMKWQTFPQTWGMHLLLLIGPGVWTFYLSLLWIVGGVIKNTYYLCLCKK